MGGRNWTWSALVWGIAGLSFGLQFAQLSATPYANGWDGYFYLVQVKAWVEEGAMHSRDISPVYLLLRALYHLSGDYILAYKLLSALLAGAFSGLVVLLGRSLTRSAWLAVLAGLWTLCSPTLAYFAGSFPKNLMGMDFLLLVLWGSVRGRGWGMWVWLGLAGVTHRMTAGLAVLFVGIRKMNMQRALVLGAMVLLGLGVSALLPGMFHLSDLARFDDAFSSTPQLSHASFIDLMGGPEFPLVWRIEIYTALALLLATTLLFAFSRPHHPHRSFIGSLLLLALLLHFPFFQMSSLSMGYRFFLAGMLLAPLFLLFLADRFRLPNTLAFPLLLAATLWTHSSFSPTAFGPNHDEYTFISQRVATHFKEHPPELLIGHKGMAEQVTFETGIDVLPWQPEYAVDSMELWRISTNIFPMDFRAYLSPGDQREVVELSFYTALLRESVWQRFVAAAEKAEDEELLERIYDWENPSEPRPAYLLRK